MDADDTLAPESTVSIKVFDLLAGTESRLTSQIGAVRADIRGLATLEDVNRVSSEVVRAHDRLDEHDEQIVVLQTRDAVHDAVTTHKHRGWRVAGWGVGAIVGALAASGAFMEGLKAIGAVH